MRPSYQQKNYAFPLWVVVSIYACLSAAKAQTVLHVPADHPTIQAAIIAPVNGDTVLVAPGTYKENANFNGKAITERALYFLQIPLEKFPPGRYWLQLNVLDPARDRVAFARVPLAVVKPL